MRTVYRLLGVVDPVNTASIAVGWLRDSQEQEAGREAHALVIAWSATEPHRIGEVAFIEDDASDTVLGRGAPNEGENRVAFARQRPGSLSPCPPLQAPSISRDQLRFKPAQGGLEVERLGRCGLLLGGTTTDKGVVRPGETVTLKHQLVLYYTRRPVQLPALTAYPSSELHPFGEADRYGIVGESPAAWELREQLAFTATSGQHTLLLGESGSGKELAARAIHGLSPRCERPLVSRNAATFPAGIVDAELFGNVRNYPNPGMDARPGLIGEADGSTLFLDEIAELPVDLQAHLLRVLDANGEYQRLGDANPRRADLRFVAATNRDAGELKHDLLARFTLRVSLPGLADRREDVPLLVRHLLDKAAKDNPALHDRFFAPTGGQVHARIDPDLVEALIRHRHTHHVRELDRLLWKAIGESKGPYVAFSDGVKEEIDIAPVANTPSEDDLSAENIRACLERHDGKVSRAWKELGLKSRYSLYRLLKKHGIEVEV